MEKKDLEMLEKRLGRKVDESFWKECREAFIELNDSGELQRHMKQRVLSTKAMSQKQ